MDSLKRKHQGMGFLWKEKHGIGFVFKETPKDWIPWERNTKELDPKETQRDWIPRKGNKEGLDPLKRNTKGLNFL